MTAFNALRGNYVFTAFTPGQSTAGTEDDWVALVAPFNLKVTGVKWTPNAAITGAATNYFTLQILNGSTVVASKAYDSGTNETALTPADLTLSSTTTDLNVDSGDALVIHKEVAGTGLAMPDGFIQITAWGR